MPFEDNVNFPQNQSNVFAVYSVVPRLYDYMTCVLCPPVSLDMPEQRTVVHTSNGCSQTVTAGPGLNCKRFNDLRMVRFIMTLVVQSRVLNCVIIGRAQYRGIRQCEGGLRVGGRAHVKLHISSADWWYILLPQA